MIFQLIAALLFTIPSPRPLDCVKDATDVYLYTGHGKIEISGEVWNNWLALKGDNVEISAKTLPEDIQGYHNDYLLTGIQDGERIEVWIRYSESEDMHFLFVFDSMRLGEDGHVHPCGGWAIELNES